MKRFTLAMLAGAVAFAACGCGSKTKQTASQMTGGDPDKGLAAINQYGCAGCHTIPGFQGAKTLAGPSLDQIAARSYIGGVAENKPDNMVRWIQNPQELSPKTAMPNLHVTPEDARNIASYLYTLR